MGQVIKKQKTTKELTDRQKVYIEFFVDKPHRGDPERKRGGVKNIKKKEQK